VIFFSPLRTPRALFFYTSLLFRVYLFGFHHCVPARLCNFSEVGRVLRTGPHLPRIFVTNKSSPACELSFFFPLIRTSSQERRLSLLGFWDLGVVGRQLLVRLPSLDYSLLTLTPCLLGVGGGGFLVGGWGFFLFCFFFFFFFVWVGGWLGGRLGHCCGVVWGGGGSRLQILGFGRTPPYSICGAWLRSSVLVSFSFLFFLKPSFFSMPPWVTPPFPFTAGRVLSPLTGSPSSWARLPTLMLQDRPTLLSLTSGARIFRHNAPSQRCTFC